MLVFIWSRTCVIVTVFVQIYLIQTNTRVNENWNSHWKLWSLIWKWKYLIWNKFVLALEYSLTLLVIVNITNTKPSCLFVRQVTKKKHKQAFGFSVCYYRMIFNEVKIWTNINTLFLSLTIDCSFALRYFTYF